MAGTSSWVPAQATGDQGEKAKGGTSVERKVPSSEACLDEPFWPTTVGRGAVYQMADGEVIGRKPVIVLEELEQGIATLFEVCRNHGVTPVTLGPWRVVRRDTRDATRLKRRDWSGTNGSLGKEIDSGW